MSEIVRVVSVEAVLPGDLKLAWNDGYEGIVDLRGLIREGEIFKPLHDPATFRQVRVATYGSSIFWGEEGDEDVDFGSARLREIAEQQAALLARAS